MEAFVRSLKKALTPLPIATDEDEAYREILEAAGREAAAELDAAGVPRQIGYTEIYEDAKKQILRHKYGVRWKPKGRGR